MSYDYEAYNDPLTGGGNLEFSEKSVRMGFIRKVYLILMTQLLITFSFVALFAFNEDVKTYTYQNPWMFWSAFAGTIACMIALSCCGDLRRRIPHNFICLGLFTLFESFLLGTACASFAPREILMAIGICVVVTLALTLFAFQTKIDFTMCGGFVFVSLIVLLLFGLLAAIFRNKILNIVYSSIGALLFSFYLVFDTQLMIGGTHKYSVSPEEYIFAALTLYLDVINLFIYIVSIIGNARN